MRAIAIIFLASLLLAVTAPGLQAQTLLQATEYQVTTASSTVGYTTPRIGQDTIGYYVVYIEYPIVNGVNGNASIYYQRITNAGQPTGSPVAVADSSENQYLIDASGDYIVYTLAQNDGLAGDIVLYQISTGLAHPLTGSGDCVSPHIYGKYVIWLEELAVGTQVLLYDVTSGFPVQTSVMAGPTPSIGDANIGDRFIAWSQIVNNQFDVAAYDMQKGLSESVSANPQLNEQNVWTNGPWITFETSAVRNPAGIAIEAINMDSGVTVAVADNGAYNQLPNISGNLLGYESNVFGHYQIFLYRLAEGDTFQVTSSSYDERLNIVYGNLVTYVDNRTGNYDVYVSSINFVSSATPVTASASPVNFGKVNLGSNSTQNVTVSINTNLTLNSIQSSGDFSVTNDSCTLPATFSAGATCQLQVQFTPTKPGLRSLPLVVTDSNSNNYDFGLLGTGVGSALAFTPGIIGTVVGTGQGGYNGDSISANSAELDGPNGLFMDSAGNLYFADDGNNRIRVVNAQPTSITVAGVTIAPGNIATVAGNGAQGNSNGTGKAITAELYYPGGVAMDQMGNLYIADTDNFLVRKVDANGNISIFAGGGGGGGCAIATNNIGDGCPATQAYLGNTTGVAVDFAGDVYIADWDDSRIRMVNPSGIISTVAGGGTGCGASQTDSVGDGCAAMSAQLQYPNSLTVDFAGNLYIADTYNNRIRKVNTSGIISTVAGSGSGGYSGDTGLATGAQLNQPRDVAMDSAGNLYISDTDNYVIRKVDANGIITTIAGFGSEGVACSFGTYIFGDGCPATSGFIGYPEGLAVDGAGNLFIADNEDSRIREVSVNASILSFGTEAVGGTSPEQRVLVSDVGNSSLNFNSFGVSSNFQPDNTGSYTYCAVGTPLLTGTSCTLGVDFLPSAPGNSFTGTLTVADDAFNSPHSVTLSGTAIPAQVAPTVSFTGAPASAPFGSTFNVVATTNASTTAVITASGACTGSAPVVMISGTGICMLTASWAADSNYLAATLSQSTAAILAATATTITSNTPNPSTAGQAVAVGFSASGSGGIPTGSVTVTASTGESCSGALTSGAGSCSLVFSTSGSRTLTATYSGDGNFNGSTSTAVSQVVQASTPAATPSFSPFPSTYIAPETVTLSDKSSGVTIYYTLDGSTPSPTNGTAYTAPIKLTATATIKAMATGGNYGASAVNSGTYTLQAATPSFTPFPSTYPPPEKVTLYDATSGVTIYYTTDGSTPSSTNGNVYSAPITLTTSTTIKAIAIGPGITSSAIATGTYTMQAMTPGFTPFPSTYSPPEKVTLYDSTSGATIYYTTDGSTPSSTNGSAYTGPITLTTSTTIKAIAIGPGIASSVIASGTYTMQAMTPGFTPLPSTYSGKVTVTLYDAMSGATVYYTTDGSTPSATNGTPYTGPVSVATTTTIKAIAIGGGYNPSAVAAGTYTINP